MPRCLPLDWLRTLRVTGPDRESFLQGQLTQDVRGASGTATLLAGLADPKGRLLGLADLFVAGDSLRLLVPAPMAEPLLARLRTYVLRSKVQLHLGDEAITGVFTDGGAPPAGSLALARAPGRSIVLGPAGESSPGETPGAWALAEIRDGRPAILPATAGEFVPQMVNLDLLDGISFTKGCYTGQEIVARTRYLGRVKRRMLRFASTRSEVAAGTPIMGERGTVGMVVAAAPAGQGSELLAVVSLADLDGPLALEGSPEDRLVRLALPYPIPESGDGGTA